MDSNQLLHYLLFTPLERLPPMPSNIESENNQQLGVQIMQLLKEGIIKIRKMDENGFLHMTS